MGRKKDTWRMCKSRKAKDKRRERERERERESVCVCFIKGKAQRLLVPPLCMKLIYIHVCIRFVTMT